MQPHTSHWKLSVTLTIPNLLLLQQTWCLSPGNTHTYPGTIPKLQHNSHSSGLKKGFPGWRASLPARGCKDPPLLLRNYSFFFFFFKEWLFRGRAAAHPRAFRAPPWPAVPAAPPRRGGTARGGQRQSPPRDNKLGGGATPQNPRTPPKQTPRTQHRHHGGGSARRANG